MQNKYTECANIHNLSITFDDYFSSVLNGDTPYWIVDDRISIHPFISSCYPERIDIPIELPEHYCLQNGNPHNLHFENLKIGSLCSDKSVSSSTFKNIQFGNYTSVKAFPTRFEACTFENTSFSNMQLPKLLFDRNSTIKNTAFNNLNVFNFQLTRNSQMFDSTFSHTTIDYFDIYDDLIQIGYTHYDQGYKCTVYNNNPIHSQIYNATFSHSNVGNFHIGSQKNGLTHSLFHHTNLHAITCAPPFCLDVHATGCDLNFKGQVLLSYNAFHDSTLSKVSCEDSIWQGTVFHDSMLNNIDLTEKKQTCESSSSSSCYLTPYSCESHVFSDIRGMHFIDTTVSHSDFSKAVAGNISFINSQFYAAKFNNLRFNLTHPLNCIAVNPDNLSECDSGITVNQSAFYDSMFCFPQNMEGESLALSRIPGAKDLNALKSAPDTYCHRTRDNLLIGTLVPLVSTALLGTALYGVYRWWNNPEKKQQRENARNRLIMLRELAPIQQREKAMLRALTIDFTFRIFGHWTYLPKNIVFLILQQAIDPDSQKKLIDNYYQDNEEHTYIEYLAGKFPKKGNNLISSFEEKRLKWVKQELTQCIEIRKNLNRHEKQQATSKINLYSLSQAKNALLFQKCAEKRTLKKIEEESLLIDFPEDNEMVRESLIENNTPYQAPSSRFCTLL